MHITKTHFEFITSPRIGNTKVTEQWYSVQYNTIQYTLLAVNIYMFVATNVGVAGDTINNIYIIT
jgi:hypothetical protein